MSDLVNSQVESVVKSYPTFASYKEYYEYRIGEASLCTDNCEYYGVDFDSIRKSLKYIHGNGAFGLSYAWSYTDNNDKIKQDPETTWCNNIEEAISDINRKINSRNKPFCRLFTHFNKLDDSFISERLLNPKKYGCQTWKAENFNHRRFLFLDFDIARGGEFYSNNSEKELAKNVCGRVCQDLKDNGFGEPYIGDSGNGYHALYKIDLQNTKESYNLIRRLVDVLNGKCGLELVKIDTVVCDISRSIRVHGSPNCKYIPTLERPERPTKVIHEGSDHVVSQEAILSYISKNNQFEKVGIIKEFNDCDKDGWTIKDVEELIIKKGKELNLFEVKSFYELGKTNSGFAEWYLTNCPFHNHHLCGLIRITNKGGVTYHCFKERCENLKLKDLLKLLGSNFPDRLKSKLPSSTINTTKSQKTEIIKEYVYTDADDAIPEIEPLNVFIPGLLTQGTTLIAGDSKIGKTVMAFRLAESLATGKPMFGKYTPSGIYKTAIYCYDMARANIVSEINNVCTDGVSLNELVTNKDIRLFTLENFNPLDSYVKNVRGCGDDLWSWSVHVSSMVKATDTKVVILDLWGKIDPSTNKPESNNYISAGILKSTNCYSDDYEAYKVINKLALELGIAVIILTHTKKSNGFEQSVFDRVQGSQGKAGASNNVLYIEKICKDASSYDLNLYSKSHQYGESKTALKAIDHDWVVEDSLKLDKYILIKSIIKTLEQNQNTCCTKDKTESGKSPTGFMYLSQIKDHLLKLGINESGSIIEGQLWELVHDLTITHDCSGRGSKDRFKLQNELGVLGKGVMTPTPPIKKTTWNAKKELKKLNAKEEENIFDPKEGISPLIENNIVKEESDLFGGL